MKDIDNDLKGGPAGHLRALGNAFDRFQRRLTQANDDTLCPAGFAGSLWPTEHCKARRFAGGPKSQLLPDASLQKYGVSDLAASRFAALFVPLMRFMLFK